MRPPPSSPTAKSVRPSHSQPPSSPPATVLSLNSAKIPKIPALPTRRPPFEPPLRPLHSQTPMSPPRCPRRARRPLPLHLEPSKFHRLSPALKTNHYWIPSAALILKPGAVVEIAPRHRIPHLRPSQAACETHCHLQSHITVAASALGCCCCDAQPWRSRSSPTTDATTDVMNSDFQYRQSKQQSKKGKAVVEPITQSLEAGPTVIIFKVLEKFFRVGRREILQSEVLRHIFEHIKVNYLEMYALDASLLVKVSFMNRMRTPWMGGVSFKF